VARKLLVRNKIILSIAGFDPVKIYVHIELNKVLMDCDFIRIT
jgi:hypothetical protein